MLKVILIFTLYINLAFSQVVNKTGRANTPSVASPVFVTINNNASLDKKEISLIRKSSFEAILSTKQLSLQLQRPSKAMLEKNDRNWYEIGLKFETIGKFYKLEFSIKDTNTGTLYNYIKND